MSAAVDGKLWPEPPGRLYCVLDTAADPGLYDGLVLLAATERIDCLYEGESARGLADAAPYLIALEPDGAAFDWLWSKRRHLVFLDSAASFADVRAHLRRLTRVRTDDGRFLLFRFYDPSTLRLFLLTCDGDALADLFGPLDRIVLVDDDAPIALSQAAGRLSAAVLDVD
jgi:hypothetical protein